MLAWVLRVTGAGGLGDSALLRSQHHQGDVVVLRACLPPSLYRLISLRHNELRMWIYNPAEAWRGCRSSYSRPHRHQPGGGGPGSARTDCVKITVAPSRRVNTIHSWMEPYGWSRSFSHPLHHFLRRRDHPTGLRKCRQVQRSDRWRRCENRSVDLSPATNLSAYRK